MILRFLFTGKFHNNQNSLGGKKEGRKGKKRRKGVFIFEYTNFQKNQTDKEGRREKN